MLVIVPVGGGEDSVESGPLPWLKEPFFYFSGCKQFFVVAFPSVDKFSTEARIDAVAGAFVVIEFLAGAEFPNIRMEAVFVLDQLFSDEVVLSAHCVNFARAFNGRIGIVPAEIVETLRQIVGACCVCMRLKQKSHYPDKMRQGFHSVGY